MKKITVFILLCAFIFSFTGCSSQTVKEGDMIDLNYVGKKDGVAFQGGTGNHPSLIIGSGRFIPGFEEQLIGMKVGETKDINLTFPENYGSKELDGQAVVFTVTINEIKEHTTVKFSK